MKIEFITVFFSILIALSFSHASVARVTPVGFEAFFEERVELVDISIAGIDFSQSVDALISYEYFKLTGGKKNLVEFLKKNKLNSADIEKVVNKLEAGINTSDQCSFDCISIANEGRVGYFFDYDNRNLTIFVSNKMFDFKVKEEYYSSVRASNALINETNLYVFNGNDNSNFTWSNDTILGLTYGHLNFDTQYASQSSTLDIRTGVYDLDLEGHRIVAGYQQPGSAYDTINTTDFLHYGADYRGLAVNIGSSDNLLIGAETERQSLNFYSPQSGQLEVHLDDIIIFTQAVRQGQNSVSYRELPNGVYTVQVIVKHGERELLNEQRSIVNNGNTYLQVGDYDYRVKLGQLQDRNQYAEGSLSYRLNERALVGGSIASDIDSSFIRIGGKYYFNDSITTQYTGAFFDSGAMNHQGNLSFGSFGITVRSVDTRGTSSGFYHALYGENNTREFGVNYSKSLFGGNTFASFFHLSLDNDDFSTQTNNLSLSWSRNLLGGQLSLSTNYSFSERGNDTFNLGMNWSYDVSDTLRYTSSLLTDDEGVDYVAQEFSLEHSEENYDATVSVAATVQDNKLINEVSAYANGTNNAFSFNGYGFYRSDNYYSASGTLKSTQLVTFDDVIITSKKGVSFVNVEPEWTSTPSEESEISYTIYKDGEYDYSGTILPDQSFVTPLPIYSQVRFELDADYSNVEISAKSKEGFTVPGTLYQLNNHVTPLHSQVFLLNDIDGNAIQKVGCAGEGCKSIYDITEGVSRVTFREEQSFHLVSEDRICVFNPEHLGEPFVSSYCLEGLNDLDENSDLVYNDMKYIGVYESTEKTLKIIERLEELGLASKYVTVGDQLYVYVRHESEFTIAQVQVLEQLETYIVSTKFKPDNIFSVTKR